MIQNPRQTSGFIDPGVALCQPILRPARVNNIVSAGKTRGRSMQFKGILAAVAIAVSLLCTVGASAQQTGTPKTPPPPTTHHSHVGRDICATHPNLPQCS
jgi:hypothetical protein